MSTQTANPRSLLHPLVRLACDLKAITGHDIGVTLKEARQMAPAELAEKIREFGKWFATHCENQSQQVEQAIFYALDDEANVRLTD